MATRPRPNVQVLCATNHAYAMPLCVMLSSLVIHHPRDRGLEIHVLDIGMTPQDRQAIEDSIRMNRRDFPMENLHWLTPDMAPVQQLPEAGYVTRECYARILAPHILPESVERVVYLDCDLVVLTDISPLFDAPGEAALHAVRDVDLAKVSDHLGVFNYAEMGIAPEAHYFNSGVLVMNLRRWREENICARVLEYLHQHRGSVWLEDQGGLNAVLAHDWTELDLTWNQMRWIMTRDTWEKAGISRDEWRRAVKYPRIVHFAGDFKPWQALKTALPLPRNLYFHRYLQKTVYRGTMRAPWLERLLGPWLYFQLWQELRPLLLRLAGKQVVVPPRT